MTDKFYLYSMFVDPLYSSVTARPLGKIHIKNKFYGVISDKAQYSCRRF